MMLGLGVRVDGLVARAVNWLRVMGVVVYPSHFRPVRVHRRQAGLSSEHLTRRILDGIKI